MKAFRVAWVCGDCGVNVSEERERLRAEANWAKQVPAIGAEMERLHERALSEWAKFRFG